MVQIILLVFHTKKSQVLRLACKFVEFLSLCFFVFFWGNLITLCLRDLREKGCSCLIVLVLAKWVGWAGPTQPTWLLTVAWPARPEILSCLNFSSPVEFIWPILPNPFNVFFKKVIFNYKILKNTR